MYAALWRALPGPVWVRIVMVVLFAAAVLYLLVEWVFPFVNQLTTPEDVTVEE